MSTYLNRTRRNLKKGEYYNFVVKIFQKKEQELEQETGVRPTEKVVFNHISDRELAERNFDLSVGRIVGLVAFDDETSDSWYPFVSNHQSEKLPKEMGRGFKPITAGNLASFLKPLCSTKPYEDDGTRRAREIVNVSTLGHLFRKAGILTPLPKGRQPTAPSVACKHWPLVAFSGILQGSNAFPRGDDAPLAREIGVASSDSWQMMRDVLAAYLEIMKNQAAAQEQFLANKTQENLDRAWAYQTQKSHIVTRLYPMLQERVPGFASDSVDVETA